MLKNIHRPAFLALFLFIVIQLSAAVPDSVKTKLDSTRVNFFYNDVEKFGFLHLHNLDTAITGYQNYDPLLKQSLFHATQGNMGQASRNLTPYPFITGSSGFDYGIHSFDPYLYKNDSIKYYKVVKTYTELQYEQGAKKEVFFRAVFSRNLYRSLNLGFNVRAMNVPGAYLRQRTNHINFVTTLQFFTKDKRYGFMMNFMLNRLKINENGGIKYDSIFEQNLEKNRQILEVNLPNAQNRIRENGFFMKHYFNLSRHPKNEKDTSLASGKRVELGRLVYSFQYNKQIQNYIDYQPNSGFYPAIYMDSTLSYDSITVTRIVNELTWSNPSFRPDKKERLLMVEARIRQLYVEVRDHDIKNVYLEYIPSAAIYFHPFASLSLTAQGDYVFGGYNQNDMSLKVNLSQTLGKPGQKNGGSVTLKGYYAFQKPGWFYEHYQGNHFRWDTTWQKQGLISGCFEYAFRNIFTTGISITRLNHYVYLDSTAHPAQYNKEFGHIYSYLNGMVDVWRFRFSGQFAYQTIQGASVLMLPAFLGNLAIYYNQPLFHGAAFLQPGLNFNYNTSYYANAYMPALQSYYLQQYKEVGNYLYIDFFINIKIQRARVFVAYTHLNASFMGRSYYTVPSYPMQDGAFHFGLAWRFHD
ncbi:MAG: hypothetical protein NTW10_10660 [Bacteroidetes bacterium]|nr:hypothetical protein [Bacteroidota bacterium]